MGNDKHKERQNSRIKFITDSGEEKVGTSIDSDPGESIFWTGQ